MSLVFSSLFPLAASVSLTAAPILEVTDLDFFDWFTNSLFVTCVVTGLLLLWARQATRRLQMVPDGTQNLFESVVEILYDTLEGIVGPHMVRKVFSLLATLFVFILFSNWFALMPGVGSIGWGDREGGFLYVPNVTVPLLRPTTADLNTTLALAVFFMVMWLYWSVREMGFGGFIKHIFGVKGGLHGVMALLLFPIFFFVGIIEVISMLFRPVSLSLRLYGNVFAGENLLVTMLTLGKQFGLPEWIAYLSSVILPIPFYFLELLIGLLQAMVFTLLCAVYIQLSTTHDDEH